MRVLAVVCANGLGHFRGTLAVLARMRALEPDLQVDVVCEPWQVERTRRWPLGARLWEASGARAVHGVVAPGVYWSQQPGAWADGRLLTWEMRLGALPLLEDADLVLSDNLTGVLTRRPDAVLQGSFLWSDVLEAAHPGDADVRAFVRHERALLERHAPPILCVDDMVMPGVAAQPGAVRLPWACEPDPVLPWEDGADPARPSASADAAGPVLPSASRPVLPSASRPGAPSAAAPGAPSAASAGPAAPSPRRPRVAVLGGATGAADSLLAPAIEALRPHVELLQPPTFRHDPAGYASCDVVVCRPGLGTLTDCLAQGVPTVLLHEPNTELEHNGRRMEALGLGVHVGASSAAVRDAVLRLAAPEVRAVYRARILARPRDGLERAARFLLDRARLRAAEPLAAG